MRHLSTTERIAQLFIVGVCRAEGPGRLRSLVEKAKFTSFILFDRDYGDAAGLASMIADTRALAHSLELPPLTFTADEEGGLISPLGRVVGRLPSPMALSAGSAPEVVRSASGLLGERLKAAGIDLVLAPVLDVNSEPGNPVIGTRSFGDNPLAVAAYGGAVIEGLHSSGLACCAKHFPGHGRTAKDSHLALPVVDASAEEISRSDLVPFRRAFSHGVEAAMAAHVSFPGLEGEVRRPSTLSKRIQTEILRGRLGFSGALLSDSMEMRGLADYLTPDEACVEALNAGVDMLICVDPDLALRSVDRIERALESGELSQTALSRALENVNALKSGAADRGPSESQDLPFDSLMEDCYTSSITVVGCKPSDLKVRLSEIKSGLLLVPEGLPGYGEVDVPGLRAELGSRELDRVWSVFAYPHDPKEEDIREALSRVGQSDSVIHCTLSRGPEPPEQAALAQAAVNTGKVRLGVALLDPYSLARAFPPDLPCAATYGFWPSCLRALIEVLFGAGEASGVLPIDINKAK